MRGQKSETHNPKITLFFIWIKIPLFLMELYFVLFYSIFSSWSRMMAAGLILEQGAVYIHIEILKNTVKK